MNAERSAALVRRWVGLYTLGLPPEARRDRRDEIDDDLWCQAQEAAGSGRADRSLAGEIVTRLVFGMPADVNWRFEQGRFAHSGKTFERSHAMHARLPAVLALIGGAAWSIGLVNIDLLAVSPGEWQGGLWPTLTLVSFLGGTVVLALAAMSLVAAAQDMISSLTAALAVIGALISAIAALGVPPVAIVALPLTSTVVVWQLSRVGALPRWVFRMHVAAPIFVLAIFVLSLAGIQLGGDSGQFGLPQLFGLAVLLLYPFSWLAIGWSLLRSRPVATDGIAGASAA